MSEIENRLKKFISKLPKEYYFINHFIPFKNGDINCSNQNLTSLEGAPEEVGGSFYCYDNELTSLEGAPRIVGGDFSCSDNKLTSLKGAPEKVGGRFWCKNPKKFTEEEVRAVCDVKGKVYV